jgi:NAD(P)-dependent dehydrogenase (short-subunit alcohol dehydrogenase family)
VNLAVQEFGDLHVLVNNAGILRDRTLANMSEDEWDSVIRVHLKGHAAPTRHALAYWRRQAKSGHAVKASVIHTTSVAAFAGNIGQANYCAAKLGVIGLSRVAALEGARYGVRSNALAPSARTRMALESAGGDELLKTRRDSLTFDPFDPANVSPLVCWLSEAACTATSQVFYIYGDRLLVIAIPGTFRTLQTTGRWTLDALDRELSGKLVEPPRISDFLPEWREATHS